LLDVSKFDRMKISLASPEKILEWSHGEVKKPETINYRTLKPERDGLFCERIFGPSKDWECHCGKYKRIRYKGIICDRCGVEVTRSKVRRERLGHIALAAPVSHIWYFKGIPSRMGLLLNISPRVLEKVLYFVSYIVTDPKDSGLEYKQILTEQEYREAREQYGADGFDAGMGAESIKKMLIDIDLQQLEVELREELKVASGQRRVKAIRRLEVVEAFVQSGNRPEWMILDVVPVIPPELRPMVQLDGGRFATSDLNDLYRRVINRNNRLRRLLDLGAPDIIVRNEKRMLQEAVDALIDNGRRGRPVTGPGNRPLKSLSDMLKGKQGRFRQNLLGKRVDYSGRSVIVVGPELKMHQCGLPKEMALELFKPFVMKRLVHEGYAHNIKSAKRKVERVDPVVWDVLEEVITEHPVLLNRAPTLHRLGIQAFEPVLVEGRALKIHPLVCTAYNADFDGDQMAVHVPLSAEAQSEARLLMLSSNNILNPKDGRPVATPTQDMVLGSYYLTMVRDDNEYDPEKVHHYCDYTEAYRAYLDGNLDLHDWIEIRKPDEWDTVWIDNETEIPFPKDENGRYKRLVTSLGRLIFNYEIPINRKMGYYNIVCGKKMLAKIVDRSYRREGISKTAALLDGIKALGYKYSTRAGITVGVGDIQIPPEKATIMSAADKEVLRIEDQCDMGLITDDERHEKVVKIWQKATDDVTARLMDNLDCFNPIFMMANSGARGNVQQIRQLAGLRGLMADPSGKIIDLPIKANFREGLTVLEFFISAHGARKGLSDTALRTADSGYLTRRLVDVSQDVIVREEDCGDTEGTWVTAIKDGEGVIEDLAERIEGRYLNQDIINDETGEIIAHKGTMCDLDTAETIVKYLETKPVEERRVNIRSVLTCHTSHGVCSKCYGRNLATGGYVDIGEAVGTIAAQSIGEPGTQLTMRTFHTGGIAGGDITQGLPRVEEIFEARKPKGQCLITEYAGSVKYYEDENGRRTVTILGDANDNMGEIIAEYKVPFGKKMCVKEGQHVEAGDQITEGPINPTDLLNIVGRQGVQLYLLQEVQKVYRNQGVDINDKHLEVMIRQMLKKVKIEDSGDTSLLPGILADKFEFQAANEKALAEGKQPATSSDVLLGITKASLATDSFLSAASFQETTRVLTDAAIKGKEDPLLGLKENVIIGKLIPAGTGVACYRDLEVDKVPETTSEQLNDNLVG
jgi:DNA-directed RNA polymerase subunit beta'